MLIENQEENKQKNKNKAIGVIAVAALVTALGVGVVSYTNATHADTTTTTQAKGGMRGGRGGIKPGVMGTVVSVSGNTITLTGNAGPRNASSTTTYTIDATNAKIEKASVSSATGTRPTLSTITVSGIAAGDHLMVQGTVSGTSVTATNIVDGQFGGGMGGPGGQGAPGFGGGMVGGIRGKVTAVNGTSITVTDTNTKDNTTATYTVDTSSAKVTKMTKGAAPTTITSSDIQVGDEVIVEGNITGSVSATTVRDQASS